jgi:hypothetical protein
MGVVSGPEAEGLAQKKVSPETITKKGPGIFVECGKVRFGKKEQWFQCTSIYQKNGVLYTDLQKIKEASKSPTIGLWGTVKKNDKPIKEIAQMVYGNPNLAEFIVKANKIVSDKAHEGAILYIPNLAKHLYKDKKGKVSSSYQFVGVNIHKVFNGPYVSGDLYVDIKQITNDEYHYLGKDNSSKYYGGGTLPYQVYIDEMKGCPDDLEWIQEKIDSILKFITGHKDEKGALESGAVAIYNNRFVDTKIGSSGTLLWKIYKGAKGAKKTQWVGRGEFIKGLKATAIEEFCAKRNIFTLIIIAGIAGYLDYRENNDIGHAIFYGVKSLYKESVSFGSGLLAGCLVALALPEETVLICGWLIVSAFTIGGSYLTSKGLDAVDNWQQKNGTEEFWGNFFRK